MGYSHLKKRGQISEFAKKVYSITDDIAELLIRKNKAYGNSALNPVRIFSKQSPVEQLKVRLDDKLSRIARGENTEAVPEDIILDTIGYLVLLKIAQWEI